MSVQRAALIQQFSAAWPTIAKVATVSVMAFVAYLLIKLGMSMDWPAVWLAANEIDTATLFLSVGLMLIGYSLYASFDLLAKRFVGHKLANWKVLGVAAMSYAMNLNLGVIVGGIAMRTRVYRRLGMRLGVAFEVVAFSTATNWIGYFWLAGVLFLSGVLPVPQGWHLGAAAIRALGAGFLALAIGYVAICAWSSQRHWKVRGHSVTLPSGGMAVLQSVLAMLSWMAMGAIVYLFLGRTIAYAEVLAILLFSGIAALMAHIPGGLGVTEAIFVTALNDRLPGHDILAAVLMYRLVYALAPLVLAVVAYAVTEIRAGRTAADPNPPRSSS